MESKNNITEIKWARESGVRGYRLLPIAEFKWRWPAQDEPSSDFPIAKGTPQESLLSQGVHLNAKGHAIAAKEILRTLDEIDAKAKTATG